MAERFEVEYLRHSIFGDPIKHAEVVSKDVLITLLESGMISVLSAQMISQNGGSNA